MDLMVTISANLERLTDILDGMHGQQAKHHESRQVHENDIWQEFHNISNHLDNMTTALEQLAMEMDE